MKGYPDLYGFPGSSSSDEFSSADEARVARVNSKKQMVSPHFERKILPSLHGLLQVLVRLSLVLLALRVTVTLTRWL